jgi:hypothetical protein
MDPTERADGERQARNRIEQVYRAIDRLSPETLRSTVIPERDLEERTIRLNVLEEAADRAGRWPMLVEARQWLNDSLDRRTSSRGRHLETGIWGTWDLGRAEDLAAIRLALEDVVSVAATLDLLDPDDAAFLADSGMLLLGIQPLEVPAHTGDPLTGEVIDTAPPWEPTPEDWAAAAVGGRSSVRRHWGTPPTTASRATITTVVGLAIVGALLGLAFFGSAAAAMVTGLAGAGAGWTLAGRGGSDEPDDGPPAGGDGPSGDGD